MTTFTTANTMTAAAREVLVLEPAAYSRWPRFLLIPGTHRIGRSTVNELALDAKGLAEHHATIEVTATRIRLTGHDRRTWVNDGPVVETNLHRDDRVAIGPCTWTLRAASADDLLAECQETSSLSQRPAQSTPQPVTSFRQATVRHVTARASQVSEPVATPSRIPTVHDDDWRGTHAAEAMAPVPVGFEHPVPASPISVTPVSALPARVDESETESTTAADSLPATDPPNAIGTETVIATDPSLRKSQSSSGGRELSVALLNRLHRELQDLRRELERDQTAWRAEVSQRELAIAAESTELARRLAELAQRELEHECVRQQLEQDRQEYSALRNAVLLKAESQEQQESVLRAQAAELQREQTRLEELIEATRNEFTATAEEQRLAEERFTTEQQSFLERCYETAQQEAAQQAAQAASQQQQLAEIEQLRTQLHQSQSEWQQAQARWQSDCDASREELSLARGQLDQDRAEFERNQSDWQQSHRLMEQARAELEEERRAFGQQQQEFLSQQSEWQAEWQRLQDEQQANRASLEQQQAQLQETLRQVENRQHDLEQQSSEIDDTRQRLDDERARFQSQQQKWDQEYATEQQELVRSRDHLRRQLEQQQHDLQERMKSQAELLAAQNALREERRQFAQQQAAWRTEHDQMWEDLASRRRRLLQDTQEVERQLEELHTPAAVEVPAVFPPAILPEVSNSPDWNSFAKTIAQMLPAVEGETSPAITEDVIDPQRLIGQIEALVQQLQTPAALPGEESPAREPLDQPTATALTSTEFAEEQARWHAWEIQRQAEYLQWQAERRRWSDHYLSLFALSESDNSAQASTAAQSNVAADPVDDDERAQPSGIEMAPEIMPATVRDSVSHAITAAPRDIYGFPADRMESPLADVADVWEESKLPAAENQSTAAGLQHGLQHPDSADGAEQLEAGSVAAESPKSPTAILSPTSDLWTAISNRSESEDVEAVNGGTEPDWNAGHETTSSAVESPAGELSTAGLPAEEMSGDDAWRQAFVESADFPRSAPHERESRPFADSINADGATQPERAGLQESNSASEGSLRSELARMFNLPENFAAKANHEDSTTTTDVSEEVDTATVSETAEDVPPDMTSDTTDDWRKSLRSLWTTSSADSDEPSPQMAVPLKDEVPVVEDNPSPSLPAEEPDGDEDSIAKYMERLMARQRRNSPAAEARESQSSPELDTVETRSASPPSPAARTTREVIEPPVPRTKIDKDATRAELQSMRQVANLSARTALARHSWRTIRTELTVQTLLSSLSSVGALAYLSAPLWGRPIQWFPALGCTLGAAYLGFRSFQTWTKLSQWSTPGDFLEDVARGFSGTANPSNLTHDQEAEGAMPGSSQQAEEMR